MGTAAELRAGMKKAGRHQIGGAPLSSYPDVLNENKKSEPISYRNEVRISQLWWRLLDSNQ